MLSSFIGKRNECIAFPATTGNGVALDVSAFRASLFPHHHKETYMSECYSTWTSCEFNGHALVDDEDAPGVRVCED